MTTVTSYISLLIILTALYYQYQFYKKAKRGRALLSDTFPEDLDDLKLYEDEDLECTQIGLNKEFEENETFSNVRNDINSYLASNKGSVEYSIIKDITERHCGNIEQQIEAITPVPIYIGLCGTVLGIIIGVLFLIFGGGLQSIVDSGVGGIQSLLTGVAIAMITTFVGVIFTILSSNNTKDSFEEYENEKNMFLSWVQVNLLPHMDGNVVTTLSVLQKNLNRFNNDFSQNTKELNKVFDGIKDSYREQADLVETVQRLNVNEIAMANIKVLRELKECTEQINQLQQFINQAGSYLTKIETLNSNLSDHYERTLLIENMGKFFMDEVKQIEVRKSLISQAVTDIDSNLHKAFEGLKDHASNEYTEFQNATTQQHSLLMKAVESQQEALSRKLEETSQIVEELHNLVDVKESMSNLLLTTKSQSEQMSALQGIMREIVSNGVKQNELLVELNRGIDNVRYESPVSNNPSSTKVVVKIPKWAIVICVFTCLVVIGTCAYFVIKSVLQ